MRVISGSARRLQLKTPEGMETRPTTDRIKETLFNMIQGQLADCRFLDLFSGSGAIGIEALSRGAETVIFVENHPAAIKCIYENLKTVRLEEHSTVLNRSVQSALELLESQKQTFDIVFMDPPYDQGHEYQVLTYLSSSALIHDETVLIVEASLSTEWNYLEELRFQLIKQKRYKTNQHIFLTR